MFITMDRFSFILLFCVLMNVWKVGEAMEYTETVVTDSGPLRGAEVEVEGIKFKSFKGIPYAAPPVGDKRFKDPEPAAEWSDVKDVVEFGHICHQGTTKGNAITAFKNQAEACHEKCLGFTHGNAALQLLIELDAYVKTENKEVLDIMNNQNEDCLTLNVYSKKLGKEVLQPVLVFIHGDAFFEGEGTDIYYGPEFLVDQDIVVLTFNYRLGPLGFLATGTDDAPGNWGLKDQVLALKWISKNIATFGGDPNKVTLYGEESGAASAHFHLFSPLSKGLFDKAILSSGTANGARALTSEQDRFSENLAKLMGASKEQAKDPKKRVEFLRSVDARNLSLSMWDALQDQDIQNNLGLPIPFLPVLEPPETKNYFMINEPIEALAEGNFSKVPIMIGFDSNEGAFEMLTPRFTIPEALEELDEDLCMALPQSLRFQADLKRECGKVADEIRKVYFGGKSIANESKEDLTNLVGDSIFVNEIAHAQRLHAKYSKEGHFVYNYYFTYDGEWNLMKNYLTPSDLRGAVLGDELFYIFNPRVVKLPLREPTKAGLDTKARMISFISNFVKTGNPTPEVSDLVPIIWEAAQEGKLNTMVIDADIKLEEGALNERMKFWEDVCARYHVKIA